MAGSAVQGAIAGEAAAKTSKAVTSIRIPAEKLKQTKAETLAPLKRDRGYSPAWVTQILQSVMIPNFVLYIKKERMMNAALAYVEELLNRHSNRYHAAYSMNSASKYFMTRPGSFCSLRRWFMAFAFSSFLLRAG